MTNEVEKDVDGQRSLRRAIIFFAVIEAAVMAAVVLLKFFRH